MIKSINQKLRFLINNTGIEKYCKRKYLDYFLIIFSIILGFHLKWEIINVATFAFLIRLILFPLPSQILGKIALFFLSLAPILLILNREQRAEEMTVLAYYFLVFTVVMVLVENRRSKEGKKDEKTV